MDVSIEIKPIELDGEIYLPFPKVLADLLVWTGEENLLFMVEDDNKVVVYNKREIEHELCPKCKLIKKKHKCASCAEIVCANCYNHLWGICKDCTGESEKYRGQ
jgi:hypothetical protein